jgi:hypothetical protein
MAGLVPAIHAPHAPTLPTAVDARHKAGHDYIECRGKRRPLHRLDDLFVAVFPFGICRKDQPHLPGSRPMLHIALALDRRFDVGMAFDINQPLQSMLLSKARHDAFTMLPDTSRKITHDAGVENSIGAIGDDIDPRLIHPRKVSHRRVTGNAYADGRDERTTVRSRSDFRYPVHSEYWFSHWWSWPDLFRPSTDLDWNRKRAWITGTSAVMTTGRRGFGLSGNRIYGTGQPCEEPGHDDEKAAVTDADAGYGHGRSSRQCSAKS